MEVLIKLILFMFGKMVTREQVIYYFKKLTLPILITFVALAMAWFVYELVIFVKIASLDESHVTQELKASLVVLLVFTSMVFFYLYNRYSKLVSILGLYDYQTDEDPDENVEKHLREVKSSIKFMGFGFGKYIDYNENSSNGLEKALSLCADQNGSGQGVKILMMNPFSSKISKYNAFDDEDRTFRKKQDILRSLYKIYELQDKGLKIQVRFYPMSMGANAAFRLFIANEDKIFASYYRDTYKGNEDKDGFPEITLKNNRGLNYFQAFNSLFNYLWNNGEPTGWQSLYAELYTSEINLSSRIKEIRGLISYYSDSNGKHSINRIAVAAVAGKDSMATIVKTLEENQYDLIIPIVVVTPTEEHDWHTRIRTLETVRKYLKKERGNDRLSFSIVLHDDDNLWKKVNKDFAEYVNGVLPTPCVGCHFYIHSIRSLLASKLGVNTVISGDREIHGKGSVKFNQADVSLDNFAKFSKEKFDVEVQFPLRYESNDNAVWRFLSNISIPTREVNDIKCFFSGKGSRGIEEINDSDKLRIDKYISSVVSHNFIDALNIE